LPVRNDEGDGVIFLAAGVIALRDLKMVVRSDIHIGRENPCRPVCAERGDCWTKQENNYREQFDILISHKIHCASLSKEGGGLTPEKQLNLI